MLDISCGVVGKGEFGEVDNEVERDGTVAAEEEKNEEEAVEVAEVTLSR